MKKPTRRELAYLALAAIVLIVAALYQLGIIPPPVWQPQPVVSAPVAEAPAASASAAIPFASNSAPAATPKKDTSKKVALISPKPKKETAKRRAPAIESAAAPAVAGTATAHGFRWEHFGVDPYATLREEAMRTRESAFRALGLPEPVVVQLMAATLQPGEKTRINVGDQLDAMLSKGGVVHRNVTVAFAAPVRGMEYAAPAEKWQVTWEGRTYTALLPEICNNWSAIVGPPSKAPLPVAPASPQQPIVAIIGSCPDVYTLKVNVWTHPALYLPGVERTHAREELEERFAYVPHVSREHGAQLRKAYAAGQAARSATGRTFRVSLIMTPEAQGGAPTITKEQVIGDVTVTGLKELQFKRTTLEQWDAIRVVANEGDVTSPPRYHGTGLHELRFFNRLPRTTLGEWDGNPVPDCIMNEHWIE